MAFWFIQRIALLLFLRAVVAQRLTNHTIDDNDPLITYAGPWNAPNLHRNSLDFGGSHMLGTAELCTATLQFTGVAIYVIAPKWPYTVDSWVQLDGGSLVLVDMSGPPEENTNGAENVGWDVVWGIAGLENKDHTLTLSRGTTNYAVVDGFMYTTQEGEPISNSSPVVIPPSSQISQSTSVITTDTGTTSLSSSPSTSDLPRSFSSSGDPPTFVSTASASVGATNGASRSSNADSESSDAAKRTIVVAVSVSVALVVLILILLFFFILKKRKAAVLSPSLDESGVHSMSGLMTGRPSITKEHVPVSYTPAFQAFSKPPLYPANTMERSSHHERPRRDPVSVARAIDVSPADANLGPSTSPDVTTKPAPPPPRSNRVRAQRTAGHHGGSNGQSSRNLRPVRFKTVRAPRGPSTSRVNGPPPSYIPRQGPSSFVA